MTRTVCILALVTVVMLTGFTTPVLSTPTETEAATATSTAGQSSAVASCQAENATSSLPPGTTSDGIENATRLLQAHQSNLQTTSYLERTVEAEVSGVTDANGSFQGFNVTRYYTGVANGTNGSHVEIHTASSNTEYWFTDEAMVSNHTNREYGMGSSYYEYQSNASTFADDRGYLINLSSGLLHPYLRDLEYSLVNTTTQDNQTLYTYSATEINETVEPNHGDTPMRSTTENISATIVVSECGIIRSFAATHTHSYQNETVTTTPQYTTSDIGERSVVAPDWVHNEIAQFDATYVDNRSAVALTHVGGRSVSNPGLFFHTPNRSLVTQINGTLETGDTVYLALAQTNSSNWTIASSVNEPLSKTQSVATLGGGDLSVSAWRLTQASYDSNVSLEVTVNEKAENSTAANGTTIASPSGVLGT